MTLSGEWTGVYDYAGSAETAVPFNASLTDVGGVIWGTTTEPNTFSPAPVSELRAEVSGFRSAREVRFRKTYLGQIPGGTHAIDYTGHVSANGQRIEGQWRILALGHAASGPFVMNRRAGEARAATIADRASVEVEP